MKISVDDKELFTLTATQKQVIENDIPSQDLDQDLKRRLEYIIKHKYDQCFKRLKEEWEPKLAAKGIQSIPTDKDAFAQLVFQQSDYKNRSQREALNS